MKNITLTLFDLLNLELEINGLVNQRNGQFILKGLLQQPLPMAVKYWINKLAEIVNEEKSIIDGLKDELVKKYGAEKADGSFFIPDKINDFDENGNVIKVKVTNQEGREIEIDKQIINPAYIEFQKEYYQILQEEKELEYTPILLSEFCTKEHPNGFEAKENYNTFFKLVVPPIE